MTAAFRLLDGPYQDHLKFNGREPRTLSELAQARADYEHRRRLGEIKALGKKFEALDALLPALAQQGIRLHNRDFGSEYSSKALVIRSGIFMNDTALLKALVAVGFRETSRETWGGIYEKVTLKHGRSLLVCLDVKKAEAVSPAPVCAEAEA